MVDIYNIDTRKQILFIIIIIIISVLSHSVLTYFKVPNTKHIYKKHF